MMIRLTILGLSGLLAACSITPGPAHQPVSYYDLGASVRTLPCEATVTLGRVTATPALQDTRIWYRYQDQPQSPRPYAISRWTAPPADLLRQHLQVALQAGPDNRSQLQLTVLRMELQIDHHAAAAGSSANARSVIELEAQLQQVDAPARNTAFVLEEAAVASPEGAAAAMARSLENWLNPLCRWMAAPNSGPRG